MHSTRTYAFRVERKQVHVFIPLGGLGPPCVGRFPRLVFPLRRREARVDRGSLLVYSRINRPVKRIPGKHVCKA